MCRSFLIREQPSSGCDQLLARCLSVLVGMLLDTSAERRVLFFYKNRRLVGYVRGAESSSGWDHAAAAAPSRGGAPIPGTRIPSSQRFEHGHGQLGNQEPASASSLSRCVLPSGTLFTVAHLDSKQDCCRLQNTMRLDPTVLLTDPVASRVGSCN